MKIGKYFEPRRKAYNLGFAHYGEGKQHCVYPIGDSDGLRTAYFDGWYDAKHHDRLSRVGIDWPTKTQLYWHDEKVNR